MPRNTKYKKLFTVGLEVPDDPTILLFKKLVRKFLWENADNGKQQPLSVHTREPEQLEVVYFFRFQLSYRNNYIHTHTYTHIILNQKHQK